MKCGLTWLVMGLGTAAALGAPAPALAAGARLDYQVCILDALGCGMSARVERNDQSDHLLGTRLAVRGTVTCGDTFTISVGLQLGDDLYEKEVCQSSPRGAKRRIGIGVLIPESLIRPGERRLGWQVMFGGNVLRRGVVRTSGYGAERAGAIIYWQGTDDFFNICIRQARDIRSSGGRLYCKDTYPASASATVTLEPRRTR